MEDKGAPLDVYDHLAQSLDLWAAIAWSKLGLSPDIINGSISMDLAPAKVAIDVAANFAEIIENRLEPEDRRKVQGLVRDLRINYVQKSKE